MVSRGMIQYTVRKRNRSMTNELDDNGVTRFLGRIAVYVFEHFVDRMLDSDYYDRENSQRQCIWVF